MKHSHDQQMIREAAFTFMQDPQERCFSLIGAAGTGKTTLLRSILDYAVLEGRDYHLTATTHEAARVIQNATGRIASTIHSYLGARMLQDEQTGEEYLVAGEDSDEELPSTTVFVDESSQLPSRLLKRAIDHGAKFVFIGDAHQLRPVNEPVSLAIDRKRCPWSVGELTTVHRQALDSPILALATEVRQGRVKIRQQLKDGEGVHVLPLNQWREHWLSALDGPVLPWRNRYCDKANRRARAARGHEGHYASGETLIFHERFETEDERVIQNGTRVSVLGAEPANIWGEQGYYLYTQCGHRVPVLQDYHARNERLRTEGEIALRNQKAGRNNPWRDYFRVKNTIADVRSGWARTVHRAQGSTFKNVYIDLRDYADSPERLSLLYTALTRASHNVYLTGV